MHFSGQSLCCQELQELADSRTHLCGLRFILLQQLAYDLLLRARLSEQLPDTTADAAQPEVQALLDIQEQRFVVECRMDDRIIDGEPGREAIHVRASLGERFALLVRHGIFPSFLPCPPDPLYPARSHQYILLRGDCAEAIASSQAAVYLAQWIIFSSFERTPRYSRGEVKNRRYGGRGRDALNDSAGGTTVVPDSRLQLLPAELRALISCIQGQAPEMVDVEWERLARLAGVHGVAPLLHRACRNMRDTMPPALLDELTRLRRQSALTGLLGLRQRDQVLEILQQADVPYLVLKGAALARVWYGDLSLRPFVDIDLLVPASQIGWARRALLLAGYKESRLSGAPHHEIPLYRPDMPCTIELHHGLTSLPLRHVIPFEELLARAITPSGEEAHVRTLSPEDTLLHLCLHLLQHVEITHGWQLRYLCDIARHLEAFAIDWQIFGERAQALEAHRGCIAVLGLAALVAHAPVPPTQVDQEAALALLRYPVPPLGDVAHHFLAAFVVALGRGDLKQAGTFLLRAMVDWNRGGRLRPQDLRPHLLLRNIGRLLRESVTEPRHVMAQLRLWLPEAETLGERERLIADLLAPAVQTEGSAGMESTIYSRQDGTPSSDALFTIIR